jgi:hypothetical protein
MLLMRGAWLVVILVGVFVLSLVFILQLFHRLDDAQALLDDADHLFRDDMVLAQRNASDAVDLAVNDVLDPIVTEQGGAAAEVPQLITFVADNSELSEAEVLAALEDTVPHTTALLLAIPLEDVTEELPALIALVSQATGLSEPEVSAAIETNFPALASAIDGLPTITGEWFTLETGLTDVNEEQIAGIPGIAEYVDTRIVDVTERQRVNFQHTNEIWPNLEVIPWLLVVIALVVVAFGSLMLVVEIKTRPLESRGGLDPVASTE